MKILVTEDNPQSLYLLEHYFSGKGHEVWTADNGLAGLELCRARGLPDVIVSDALMPVMDGFELCIEIRHDPGFRSVPFVLYTATYTAESDERFALSIGVDRFVIKPIEPERLLKIVEEVVSQMKNQPERAPSQPQLAPGQLQDYTRMVLVKLEDKLTELSRANAALKSSGESIRVLNDKLVTTVHRLETEIDQHRRADELLHMAQSAGGIGCWESTTAGLVHWTEEARILLGYPATGGPSSFDEYIQQIVPEDRPRAEAALRALVQHGEKIVDLETRFLCPGQSKPKHLLLRGALLPGKDPQSMRWLGIIQDVSMRKEADMRRQQLEQQLYRSQKMEALGNLAGGIAHDFNNILTAILGHADLLRMELRQSPSATASVAEIEHAGQRAREIIRQILTFSRRQPVERQSRVFSKVVEDALRLVRSTIGKSNVVHANLTTDRQVCVNEGQIQQILLNLCTNAAHAMAPRGGIITVNLAALDIAQHPTGSRPMALQPGAYVRLDITDTGSGMEPAVIEHIFEPFFTTKTASEGTGLGLAVVHGIVRAHEGTIHVESTVGKGSTFSIYLPASPGTSTPAPDCPASETQHQGSGESILIVDDEPSVARTCAQLLEKLNYRTTVVTDPAQARELFEKSPASFSAVLVDYLMPRITGLDLARAFWSVRREIPVILVAGFGAQMDATRAKAEGFRDFLTKPFTTASLAISLARTLTAANKPKTAP